MSFSKGLKILSVFFGLMLVAVVAFAVPAVYTIEGEEDPSLEDPQVLDLDAEIKGHRSLEQIGAEDAEAVYYSANADMLDRALVAEMESGVPSGGSRNTNKKELESEFSTLK